MTSQKRDSPSTKYVIILHISWLCFLLHTWCISEVRRKELLHIKRIRSSRNNSLRWLCVTWSSDGKHVENEFLLQQFITEKLTVINALNKAQVGFDPTSRFNLRAYLPSHRSPGRSWGGQRDSPRAEGPPRPVDPRSAPAPSRSLWTLTRSCFWGGGRAESQKHSLTGIMLSCNRSQLIFPRSTTLRMRAVKEVAAHYIRRDKGRRETDVWKCTQTQSMTCTSNLGEALQLNTRG